MSGIARRILLHLQNKYATIPAMSIAELFLQAMREQGAGDIACARIADGPVGLPFAVSMTIRLSDAVVEEIAEEPTYTYFHHYRTVNAFLDQLALKAGLYLQEKGARYIAVAASQSVPAAPGSKATPFDGRYSHKKAAGLAGLGAMGRSNLFLHREWGPRVRLVTVFTDWSELAEIAKPAPGVQSAEAGDLPAQPESSVPTASPELSPRCAACSRCVDSCPAGAIAFSENGPAFDPEKCSAWMKTQYQHIGRGAVCGICMRVCPGRT